MARNFNGTSDRIDFPDHSGLDWSTVMSVACWVWRDVSNDFQSMCGHTAGTVGSNEVLLRSRDARNLAVSHWLGKGFSANGNHIWFVDYQLSNSAVTTSMLFLSPS